MCSRGGGMGLSAGRRRDMDEPYSEGELRCSCLWNEESELASFSLFAFHCYAAVMQFHDVLNYRESYACAPDLLHGGVVHSIELFKYYWQRVRRHSEALVRDRNINSVVPVFHGDVNITAIR